MIGGTTRANVAGALGGAILGGVIGAAIQSSASQTTAWEYVIETDVGALITIVQGGDPLQIGSSVIVLYGAPSRIIAG
jgi:outer membrane lipoprotein SlyB